MSTVIAGDGCWRLQLLLLLLAGAVAVLRSASYAADRTPVLVPNVPLSDQAVADGGTAVYLLEDLKASTSYEVRISYPASNPAKFTLYWKQPDGAGRGSAADSGSSPIRLSRELLDTEKLVFFTGENAEIPNVRPDSASGRYAIVVHVRRESPTHLQSIRLRPIYFNIVLEELFHGVPYPVFRIVVWAVVGLWLIWRVLIPKFFSRIWPFSAMYSP